MNRRQRKKYLKSNGLYVNPSELWNLDKTISDFILPRLKAFKTSVRPPSKGWDEKKQEVIYFTEEEYSEILNKIINSFQMISDGICFTRDKKKECDEGLELFAKYIHTLWN